jgi:hypothetical protein
MRPPFGRRPPEDDRHGRAAPGPLTLGDAVGASSGTSATRTTGPQSHDYRPESTTAAFGRWSGSRVTPGGDWSVLTKTQKARSGSEPATQVR